MFSPSAQRTTAAAIVSAISHRAVPFSPLLLHRLETDDREWREGRITKQRGASATGGESLSARVQQLESLMMAAESTARHEQHASASNSGLVHLTERGSLSRTRSAKRCGICIKRRGPLGPQPHINASNRITNMKVLEGLYIGTYRRAPALIVMLSTLRSD